MGDELDHGVHPHRWRAALTALEPVVCRASVADVSRIAPLFDAYRQFYGAASDIAASGRFLAERLARDESVVLLAIVGASPGEVVGFTQLYPCFSSVSIRAIVILNDLFVVPAQRGRGVAGRLIDAAAAYARSAGAIRIELATWHRNHTALRLYLAKGFIADAEFRHLSFALLSGHRTPVRSGT